MGMRAVAGVSGVVCVAAVLAPGVAQAADQPFVSSVFAATHNSFSGNVAGGSRGSIAFQLDHGVRFIELDIQDNSYSTDHDYSIGHASAGNEVDPAGNPASFR